MEISGAGPFVDYYGRLRDRTRAVVACIPAGRMEWRPREGAFSFGDILRHVGAIERYVFAENARLRPSRYPGHGRELADGHEAVLSFFERTHRETIAILRDLTAEDLRRRCELPSGATLPVWKWLRALAEHEVHHRGQLYLMLRLIDVPTPPMYGLTSEQVRARSLPLEGAPFRDHFSATAAAYAAHRPSYPAALVDFLAEVAPGGTLAWDAGCGSGQLAVLLAERFERVVATDASDAQLAHAMPHPRVEYRRAPAEASGLPDGVVDLAVAAQAAHWFDPAAYEAEVRRVTRDDGVVALASYGLVRVDSGIDPLIRRFHGDALGPYWPAERRHVEEGYRSLPFPFDEMPAPELEMRAEWTLEELLGYVGTWSAVRALRSADGGEAYASFRAELAGAWGAAETRRPVRWPLSLRVGRV